MNVMVDLETMGTGPTSAIIAIGAVKFTVAEGPIEPFYCAVDLASSVKAGLTMDPDTVLWWMKQSDEARAAFARKGLPLAEALAAFTEWAGQDRNLTLWGNGGNFDNVILNSAYVACGQVAPWQFWNDRCYRTMKAAHTDVPFQRLGTAHNALDDAVSQADHLVTICRTKGIQI